MTGRVARGIALALALLGVGGRGLGERIHVPTGHIGTIEHIQIHPTGSRAVSVDAMGLAILWDLESGRELHAVALPVRGGRVQVTPNLDTLFWITRSTVLAQPLAAGAPRVVHRAESASYRLLTLVPDGSAALVATYAEVVEVPLHTDALPLVRWDSATAVSVGVSKNSRWIVVAELNGAVMRLDRLTGRADTVHRRVRTDRLASPSSGQGASISDAGLVALADGDSIVVTDGSATRTAWRRRLSGAEEQLRLRRRPPPRDVGAVQISAGGDTVIAVHADGGIRFWNATTGEQFGFAMRRPSSRADSFDWVPGSLRLLGGHGKTLHLWDLSTGYSVRMLNSRIYASEQPRFCSSDDIIDPGSEAPSWSAVTGAPAYAVGCDLLSVDAVSRSRRYVLQTRTGTFTSPAAWFVRDVLTGDTVGAPQQLEGLGGLDLAAVSDDGRTAAMLSRWPADTIAIWRADLGIRLDLIHMSRDVPFIGGHLAFSPRATELLLAADGLLVLHRLPGGNTHMLRDVFGESDRAVLFDAEGDLWVGSISGSLIRYDVRSGAVRDSIALGGAEILELASAPTGRRLVAADAAGVVHVVAPTGSGVVVERRIQGGTRRVRSVAISDDELLLATSGTSGAVHVWSTLTGRELYARYDVRGRTPEWVAVADDGRFEASAGAVERLYFLDGLAVTRVARPQDAVPRLVPRLVESARAAAPAQPLGGPSSGSARPRPRGSP